MEDKDSKEMPGKEWRIRTAKKCQGKNRIWRKETKGEREPASVSVSLSQDWASLDIPDLTEVMPATLPMLMTEAPPARSSEPCSRLFSQ